MRNRTTEIMVFGTKATFSVFSFLSDNLEFQTFVKE